MEIQKVKELYSAHPKVKALSDAISKSGVRTVFAEGLCASAPAIVMSALAGLSNRVFLFILDDLEEAGYFYHDMVQMLGENNVLFFPSSFKRAVKYGQFDSASEILRTEVISRLSAAPSGLCIVTYPDAVAETVVGSDDLKQKMLRIKVGDSLSIPSVETTLFDYGFQRTDYVYEPGQFAIRGSIVDVYSFSSEYPFRIDFFGDDVDSIRTFDVQSQLSEKQCDEVLVVPNLNDSENGRVSLLTFLPDDAVIGMHDTSLVHDSVETVYRAGFSMQAIVETDATGGDAKPLERKSMLLTAEEFSRQLVGFCRVEFGLSASVTPDVSIGFSTSPQPKFHKNFEIVGRAFSDFQTNGYGLYILADSQKQTERLRSIFSEMTGDVEYDKIVFTPVDHTIHGGFADNDLKCCLFTDHQIFDRFHKYNLRSDKARSGKVALTLKEIRQFEIGDYVVHIDHGVGRFMGLVRIPSGQTTQEVIKIAYQNDDVVFVSIHSLHKVSKYKGKEGTPPRVNKLGTGAWEKLKDRTKTKIKDIARDLIKLYSQRREEKGFAFSHDSFMQHELEASFLYEDTPDQLKATQEVKADMESLKPMDRLVCGDVGFGKTEIAIRAAFKAACDNKQVAVLVPTTVLAYQHYQTFSARLKDFPVKVEYLSRARSAAKSREILKELADGRVNIIVGTHKLIGKSVKFKDLGLLIIDEEQKFGVSVKEKLRQMKVNVDTLTMTATPIPRTLQFSLMGARDLSVIQTPPPNRYPIQTEVHTFSAEVIADAINFEMSRNGQVFIVNSRISNLYEIENLIHKHVPDARVCIGHGQMEPEKLEQIIYDFVNYDYDVLVSTTIIESGIDIPNANTIIVNSAQNFGLSDLHQMRGRVGRSNKKAFCYLLAPPMSALTPEARRRLQAIENFSDLGSGIHIAMQDLDIRGAGNMLGAEQSGFIADLGYETYQKILSEAIKELKNDEFQELYADEAENAEQLAGDEFVDDCSLESDLEMFFPEEFVPSSSERMLLYRELDALEKEDDVAAFRSRLVDRFGAIPEVAEELIRVVALRQLGKHFGAEKINLKAGKMFVYFVSNIESPFYRSNVFGQCITYACNNPRRCNLIEKNGKRYITISDVGSVAEAINVLDAVKQTV